MRAYILIIITYRQAFLYREEKSWLFKYLLSQIWGYCSHSKTEKSKTDASHRDNNSREENWEGHSLLVDFLFKYYRDRDFEEIEMKKKSQ